MIVRKYEYYFERFKYGLSLTKNVDYGCPQSVATYNKGAKIYRAAAEAIGKLYPDRISSFAEMLVNGEYKDRVTCAICILSLMNADSEIQKKALAIIIDVSTNGTSLERTAYSMWLRDHGYQVP